MKRGIFSVNHASNSIPIQARMPKEKQATLDFLDATLMKI